MEPKRYPVVEIFHSIQGEGIHAGKQMCFVRLAGCNVGVFQQPGARLPVCTTALGESFICDTMYNTIAERLTAEEIAARVAPMKHVCITGGEPFIHDLKPLVKACDAATLLCTAGDAALSRIAGVSIETSGTRAIPDEIWQDTWITCSPKQGFLQENALFVDEWKFVITPPGPEHSLDTWSAQKAEVIHKFVSAGNGAAPVYLQPANFEHSISDLSLVAVKRLLQEDPRWRLSLQLHKIIGVR